MTVTPKQKSGSRNLKKNLFFKYMEYCVDKLQFAIHVVVEFQ